MWNWPHRREQADLGGNVQLKKQHSSRAAGWRYVSEEEKEEEEEEEEKEEEEKEEEEKEAEKDEKKDKNNIKTDN